MKDKKKIFPKKMSKNKLRSKKRKNTPYLTNKEIRELKDEFNY